MIYIYLCKQKEVFYYVSRLEYLVVIFYNKCSFVSYIRFIRCG